MSGTNFPAVCYKTIVSTHNRHCGADRNPVKKARHSATYMEVGSVDFVGTKNLPDIVSALSSYRT